jgi:cysteine desulfurase/selenocysteine lyase
LWTADADGVVATASVRASFYLYTTPAGVDALVEGLDAVKRYFGI